MASKKKRVYLFDEGDASMNAELGGKGANLAEMTNLGLPVPPGFTIDTATCNEYLAAGNKMPAGLWADVETALSVVEERAGKKFGDPQNALLVSVRSGARFSMPGMMDTVLNLGLNPVTIEGLIAGTGNPRFAYDGHRRFVMMFSDIVLSNDFPKLKKEHFEGIFNALKAKVGAKQDTDVGAEDLAVLVGQFKEYFRKQTGYEFPDEPKEQLRLAIEAVFKSWNNPRAFTYRNKEKIPHDLGTAVNVQTMVFGNMGDDSGTGVAFTRDAATGERVLYGEYLMNAQGEDVVAGVRTPMPISDLKDQNPKLYNQFEAIAQKLEKHYRNMQDIEFTIEKGRLYILQCRNGKRTPAAAIKIAVDQAKEKLITKDEAVLRVEASQLEGAMHPQLKDVAKQKGKAIAQGLNAGPGAATGRAAFDADTAARLGKGGRNEQVILVSAETTPDDIHGMLAAQGVLTSRGGRTSHAALVARQFGIPTICGCGELSINGAKRQFTVGDTTVSEGDWITIDGTTGVVYKGQLPIEASAITGEFAELMEWADKARKLMVWTNADSPEQAAEAVRNGAQGIGLCRTEHMFLGDRVPIVQRMILAEDDKVRQKALDQLLPLQKTDFLGIFEAMEGRPVVVRLIDPPLHEFLPNHSEVQQQVYVERILNPTSKKLAKLEALLGKMEEMHEANPMLGLRGCRLSIVFPQIVQMQVSAIIGAACDLKARGLDVHPEVMIPLVGHVNELKHLRGQLEQVAKDTMEAAGVKVDYKFGTMIEIPRACLTADEIAQEAEFFSFGTNDLTQMTFGISRDDAGGFLPQYIEKKILKEDPTVSIDVEGVGKLMRLCVDLAKQANPKIKLGICGEHGGDPASVKFCHKLGLDYVSCSPKRVPVARLAAAQAALEEKAA
jgi:pyruvate,orthophosphate dikinase